MDFIEYYEEKIDSIDKLRRIIDSLARRERVFAWRGQKDSSWSLHSKLYRRLINVNTVRVRERSLQREEDNIIERLRSWGLHNQPGHGRLSYLNQLAMLQHYGAPTRLIDVSFNAWVAVWFAVERGADDADARLFAFDVTNTMLNSEPRGKKGGYWNVIRNWEDSLGCPWADFPEWETTFFAWKPPAINRRIFSQNAGFLLGGVPKSSSKKPYPKGKGKYWKIEDVAKSCSISIRPHVYGAIRGRPPDFSMYTFKINSKIKKPLRDMLRRVFGYDYSVMYPDYSGFSEHGLK
ncbi:MAG: FRG domain-containing protein [Pseudomonadota bacterium]|nr:FRG domain-containing protein [Pseudomonadota bacterium]